MLNCFKAAYFNPTVKIFCLLVGWFQELLKVVYFRQFDFRDLGKRDKCEIFVNWVILISK